MGANDALAARRTTISMFPDCNSSSVVIDFRDHIFINNEKVGAGFACKTNGFIRKTSSCLFVDDERMVVKIDDDT